MDLSAEEYGRYWQGAIRIAAGALLIGVGHQVLQPLLGHPRIGPTLFGAAVFALFVLAGTFVAVLGLARVIRTAVRVER